MKHALLAAAIAIAAVTSVRAQDAVQIVEAPLAALDGDWVPSDCGGAPDLTATEAGQALTFQWTDTTGLSNVEIDLRIKWRHHAARPCAVRLNGMLLGALAEPVLVLKCEEGSVYETQHLLAIPADLYAANGLNKFELIFVGDRGESVGVCDDGFALRFEIRAVPSPIIEREVQVVEASLASLGGTFLGNDCGGGLNLSAYEAGQEITFSFTDTTGYAEVDLHLEINWRHHRGPTCEVFLNGVSLGRLDQPVATFECLKDVFYPTLHVLRIPSGTYVAGGANSFRLVYRGGENESVGICDGLHGAALKFMIHAASEGAPPPPRTDPMYPQGLTLYDLTTGIVLAPGVAIPSANLQIMAILNDADADYAALEIEIQNVGLPFAGVPFIQTVGVMPGGRAFAILPALGPGLWQIQVRTIDQRGSTSEWVRVETVIEVREDASGRRTYVGVQRSSVVDDAGKVVILRPEGGSSSGGSCSAGAASGRSALLVIFGALILMGAARLR